MNQTIQHLPNGDFAVLPASRPEVVGEHYIAYAYASSTIATRLGRGRSGCYYIRIAGKDTACASLDDAMQRAKAAGTSPSRWSVDHPGNASFLAPKQRRSAERAGEASYLEAMGD